MVSKFLPLLLLAAGAVQAQRPKPVLDPETKDGLLIQHIQQERDPTEKLHYMEHFAALYPSHPAAAWVYDQLQPVYFRLKEYDQAMLIGTLRLAIEPENLEAGEISLRAADAKHDPDQTLKWADRVWQIAAKAVAKGGVNAAQARQTQTYSEYCIYSTAEETTDLKTRLELLQGLEQRNPSSQFAQNLTAEYFQIYRQLGDAENALAMAEKGLESDPGNVAMLMALADSHFRKDDARHREKVIAYTAKVIEVMESKTAPEKMSQEDWEKYKSQMLGTAYYMGGVSSSLNNAWARADTMLRAALPKINDNAAIEATALYHLGLANYRLADKGGANRPVDALNFMRRCAAIKSPFQEQAAKNVDAIKSEYNLP